MQSCILAIETSCDDTAIAIVENGKKIHSSLIASQTQSHKKYGGVVPELASRLHTEKINPLIHKCLKDSNLNLKNITHIAVTYGPGLEGALIIGITAGQALSKALALPLIGVNHLHGHIYSAFSQDPEPQYPFIACIVSGGHTLLVQVNTPFKFNILGQTRDDAAGEAFDKIARLLNIGYPGGPAIEKEALSGNPKAFHFPRAMKNRGLEFSFSGLKTATTQTVEKLAPPLPLADLCASFQAAVTETILEKCSAACAQNNITQLVLCGGVSANLDLQTQLQQLCNTKNITLHIPPKNLNTDNAAMIAITAHHMLTNNILPPQKIQASPNLKFSCLD